MSRISIKNESSSDGPFSSYGTKVEMDGREVREIRSIVVRAGVDSPLTAEMEVFVTRELDICVDAHAQIWFKVVDPSFAIEETPLPNGGRRIVAVPR